MIITLNNGRQVEVKNINITSGQVDYRRIDDPVYGGDCVMYHPFTDEATVEAEVTAALNASEEEREAAQTAADLAREAERLAAIALADAKAQSIVDNLPSWQAVSDAIDAAATLAACKIILKKLARVVCWIAKNKAD